MDSCNYQIILHSAALYMPSKTQTLACLVQVPCIFIYLSTYLVTYINFWTYLWHIPCANKYLLMDTGPWWVTKLCSEGMKRQTSEQLSFPYHIYQRQFLSIYSCLPFRLHHTHNSFNNHCPSYLLFKDTAADEAIFCVWLQRLHIINN